MSGAARASFQATRSRLCDGSGRRARQRRDRRGPGGGGRGLTRGPSRASADEGFWLFRSMWRLGFAAPVPFLSCCYGVFCAWAISTDWIRHLLAPCLILRHVAWLTALMARHCSSRAGPRAGTPPRGDPSLFPPCFPFLLRAHLCSQRHRPPSCPRRCSSRVLIYALPPQRPF